MARQRKRRAGSRGDLGAIGTFRRRLGAIAADKLWLEVGERRFNLIARQWVANRAESVKKTRARQERRFSKLVKAANLSKDAASRLRDTKIGGHGPAKRYSIYHVGTGKKKRWVFQIGLKIVRRGLSLKKAHALRTRFLYESDLKRIQKEMGLSWSEASRFRASLTKAAKIEVRKELKSLRARLKTEKNPEERRLIKRAISRATVMRRKRGALAALRKMLNILEYE